MKILTVVFTFFASVLSLCAKSENNSVSCNDKQLSDCRIIITTPGYTSVYRYSVSDFCSGVKRDMRFFNTSVECRDSLDVKLVDIVVNNEKWSFEVSEKIPVIRFMYDRNRRKLSPIGINYRGNVGFVVADSISNTGSMVLDLPEVWNPDDVRRLVGVNDFNVLKGRVLIMDANVDENGVVSHITEVGGAPKQMSQIVVDYLYEMIARGWKPIKTGVTKRMIIPLVIKI